MATKNISLKLMLDECVLTLNKEFEKQEINKAVGMYIVTKGKNKKIKFYMADTETGDRTMLFEREYNVNNPAEFLKSDLNFVLYRELFYNCFAFFSVNMESLIKERQAKEAAEALAKGEYPEDSKEAVDPVDKALEDAKKAEAPKPKKKAAKKTTKKPKK